MTFITHTDIFACILIPIMGFLYFHVKSLLKDIEQRDTRIRQLSDMLQVAEYNTGVPYYSCINKSQYPFETPEWMYRSAREQILLRTVGIESTAK